MDIDTTIEQHPIVNRGIVNEEVCQGSSGPALSASDRAIIDANQTLTAMANVGLISELGKLTSYGYEKLGSTASLKPGDIIDTGKPEDRFSPVVVKPGSESYYENMRMQYKQSGREFPVYRSKNSHCQ